MKKLGTEKDKRLREKKDVIINRNVFIFTQPGISEEKKKSILNKKVL